MESVSEKKKRYVRAIIEMLLVIETGPWETSTKNTNRDEILWVVLLDYLVTAVCNKQWNQENKSLTRNLAAGFPSGWTLLPGTDFN